MVIMEYDNHKVGQGSSSSAAPTFPTQLEKIAADTFIDVVKNLVKDDCDDALYREMENVSNGLANCCPIFNQMLVEAQRDYATSEHAGKKKLWPICRALDNFINSGRLVPTHKFIADKECRSKFFLFPQNLVATNSRGKPQYTEKKFNADLAITASRRQNKDKDKDKKASAADSFLVQSLRNNLDNNSLSDPVTVGGLASNSKNSKNSGKRSSDHLDQYEQPKAVRVVSPDIGLPGAETIAGGGVDNASQSQSLIILEMQKLMGSYETKLDDRLDTKFRAVDESLNQIKNDMQATVETEVQKSLNDKVQHEINPRFVEIEGKIDNADTRMGKLDGRIGELEAKSVDYVNSAAGGLVKKVEDLTIQVNEFKESRSLGAISHAPGAVTRNFLDYERKRKTFSDSANKMVASAQLRVFPKPEFTKIEPATRRRLIDEVKMKEFLGTAFSIVKCWPRGEDNLGVSLRLYDNYKKNIRKSAHAIKLVKNRRNNGGIGIEFDFEPEFNCDLDFGQWKDNGYIQQFSTTYYGKYFIQIDDQHHIVPACPRDLAKLLMNEQLTANLIKLSDFTKYFHYEGEVYEVPQKFVARKQAILENRVKRDEQRKKSESQGAVTTNTQSGASSTPNSGKNSASGAASSTNLGNFTQTPPGTVKNPNLDFEINVTDWYAKKQGHVQSGSGGTVPIVMVD